MKGAKVRGTEIEPARPPMQDALHGVMIKRSGVKKIGLSQVSASEYYRRINEMTQASDGGVASARVVLDSVNRRDEVAVCRQIAMSARALGFRARYRRYMVVPSIREIFGR